MRIVFVSVTFRRFALDCICVLSYYDTMLNRITMYYVAGHSRKSHTHTIEKGAQHLHISFTLTAVGASAHVPIPTVDGCHNTPVHIRLPHIHPSYTPYVARCVQGIPSPNPQAAACTFISSRRCHEALRSAAPLLLWSPPPRMRLGASTRTAPRVRSTFEDDTRTPRAFAHALYMPCIPLLLLGTCPSTRLPHAASYAASCGRAAGRELGASDTRPPPFRRSR